MEPPCAVESPNRAAGFPPIKTVADPATIVSGGPVHVAISPTVTAGMPPINTVATPGPIQGPPTCGVAGGVIIGHTCISFNLAAGCPILVTGYWLLLFYSKTTIIFKLFFCLLLVASSWRVHCPIRKPQLHSSPITYHL